MKACLMKVNYDPKYTTPHTHKPYESLHVRLNVAKNVYSSSHTQITKVKESLEEAARKKLRKQDVIVSNGTDLNGLKCPSVSKTEKLKKQIQSEQQVEKHHEGVARAHEAIKLQPLKEENRPTLVGWSKQQSTTAHLHNLLQEELKVRDLLMSPCDRTRYPSPGPYSEKRSHRNQTQSSFPLFQKRSINVPPRTASGSIDVAMLPYHRSKTFSTHTDQYFKIRSPAMKELEKKAKYEADQAIKNRKVFTIVGPYHTLRHSLRRRGWVEKFPYNPAKENSQAPRKTSKSFDADNDDDHLPLFKPQHREKENFLAPWEEENGYYALMSNAVKNFTPSFMFTVKSIDVESRNVKSGQLVNHFGKARNFTTKVGLCQNLRNLPWYDDTDPNTFYPRCYKLDESDEHDGYIDDYRRTACFGFVQCFYEKYKDYKEGEDDTEDASAPTASTQTDTTSQDKSSNNFQDGPTIQIHAYPPDTPPPIQKHQVSVKALEMAIQQCERFLKDRAHGDIDTIADPDVLSDTQWQQFLHWYYQFVHEGGDVVPVSESMVTVCKELISNLRGEWSQFELDGTRNVWILKPGAMSRGRGIQCLNRLDTVLRFLEGANDSCLVIQKYIERPFLIYNTKFDIRQWFLVTDWNPLTIWFYKDYYLRFCSQEYTLDNFHVSIHLSNNSVQKNFSNSGKRSEKLPADNMWLSSEFEEYVREKGMSGEYKKKVTPGMKKAIICSLLCTQEFIEPRKCAFELYGADFMLTDDMQPWLLEINSSPSMARNTKATARLVDHVLEDTLKVVLDRKTDKNCDTGGFQLIYRQSVINDPPPTDPSLAVTGRRIRNKYKTKQR